MLPFTRYDARLLGLQSTHPSYSDVVGDGLCFVQPVLQSGAISGQATSIEIGQAAYTMLQTCVIERGMGGMASNIGECSKIMQS